MTDITEKLETARRELATLRERNAALEAGLPALEHDQGIFWCHIVWALKPGDLRVVAICSTAEIADRYVRDAVGLFPEHRLHAERAPLDHLFGGSDLRSVAFRASLTEWRRRRPAPRPTSGDTE